MTSDTPTTPALCGGCVDLEESAAAWSSVAEDISCGLIMSSSKTSSDLDSSGELDTMLDQLDIDRDCDVWHSFRSTVKKIDPKIAAADSTRSNGEENPETPSWVQEESETPAKTFVDNDLVWTQRLGRDEVYSHRYNPTNAEKKEISRLEVQLGVHKPELKKMFRSRPADSPATDGGSVDVANWDKIVETKSTIILKRGPCLRLRPGEPDSECEVVLLTNGVVVAKASKPKGLKKLTKRSFRRCFLLSDIQLVRPHKDKPTSWEVHLKAPDEGSEDAERNVLVFVCATPMEQQAWFDAMEKTIIEYHMHSHHDASLGWQYRYVHKPAFSMAVTNEMDERKPPDGVIDELDSYHGYTPLHYAVRCNNALAVKCLLRIGADPNLPDKEGLAPMYYAKRDGVDPTIISMLEKRGGKESKMAEIEQRGELFSRAQASEQAVQDRFAYERRQKEEAAAAKSAMNENMHLMHQRGQKIEEIGSAARELNHGAQDFGAMARQLKDQSKKKKWYQL